MLEDTGTFPTWRNGNGKTGFDKEPDNHNLQPNNIVTIEKSSNPGHAIAKSPDGTTTLSIQKDGKKEVRDGHSDGAWEQGFLFGNRYMQYQSKLFTLYDPETNLPF